MLNLGPLSHADVIIAVAFAEAIEISSLAEISFSSTVFPSDFRAHAFSPGPCS